MNPVRTICKLDGCDLPTNAIARRKPYRQRSYHCSVEHRTIDERAGHLKERYGVTSSQYRLMLESQKGGCAICGSTNPKGKGSTIYFAVDHDHATGKVRGLLCKNCNTALGLMADNPEILRAGARYLEENK